MTEIHVKQADRNLAGRLRNRLLSYEEHPAFNDHNLAGFLHMYHHNAPQKYYIHWKQNLQSNLIRMEEYRFLNALTSYPIILLKGLALLDNCYENYGQRFMCDSDYLVEDKYYPQFLNTLSAHGYLSVEENKWHANDFKQSFLNPKSGLVIEVHNNKLIYTDDNLKWNYHQDADGSYRLDLEYQLCHLVSHFVVQHGMDNLTQFVDIVLFLDVYGAELDWTFLYALGRKQKSYKAINTMMSFINNTFCTRYPIDSQKHVIDLDLDHLVNSYRNKLRRYWWKHILQDKLKDAILYDMQWLKNQGYKR